MSLKKTDKLLPQYIYKIKKLNVYGEITEIQLIRENELTFLLEADSLEIRNRSLSGRVKFICRLGDAGKRETDSLYNLIRPGNYVKLSGSYSKGREMRNPGEFDYNKYLNSLGISGTLIIPKIQDIKILNDRYKLFESAVFSVRKYLDGVIRSIHNKKTASLLRGLLLADRSEIDFATRTQFINAGVMHILAVSGLHVGFVAIVFIFMFGRLNIYLRSVLTISGLFIFMIITGIQSSVFRATLMAVFIIFGFLSNRTTNLFNSLSLAALIILIFKPDDLFNPGFQLSFAAVLGIALIYPPTEKFFNSLNIKNNFLRYILLSMAVSLSAQAGTLPLTLLYFGKLSIISLAANLLVILVSAIIVGTGILSLFINGILPAITVYYASANDLIAQLLFYIVEKAGSADFAFIPVKNFSVYDSVLFYFFLFFLLYSLHRITRIYLKITALVLIVLNFLFLSSLDNYDLLKNNRLSIAAIDVGQGDAVLVRFPEGTTALIDAGNVTPSFDNGERVILPLLQYFGVEEIDYAFVSHLDSDHYAGFVSLVNAGVIRKIIKPEIDTALAKDVKFEKYLAGKGIPVEYYKKGIMEIDGVRVYVLNNEIMVENISLSPNDKSGVLKMVFGRTSFLFTGDIERKAEDIYSGSYRFFLDADMLKVAHHGSNTSSTPDFIRYVSPELSIISAGIQNKFNHPAEEVVRRLENYGSKIYRTDKYGALIFESDGDSIRFIDWRRL